MLIFCIVMFYFHVLLLFVLIYFQTDKQLLLKKFRDYTRFINKVCRPIDKNNYAIYRPYIDLGAYQGYYFDVYIIKGVFLTVLIWFSLKMPMSFWWNKTQFVEIFLLCMYSCFDKPLELHFVSSNRLSSFSICKTNLT